MSNRGNNKFRDFSHIFLNEVRRRNAIIYPSLYNIVFDLENADGFVLHDYTINFDLASEQGYTLPQYNIYFDLESIKIITYDVYFDLEESIGHSITLYDINFDLTNIKTTSLEYQILFDLNEYLGELYTINFDITVDTQVQIPLKC